MRLRLTNSYYPYLYHLFDLRILTRVVFKLRLFSFLPEVACDVVLNLSIPRGVNSLSPRLASGIF